MKRASKTSYQHFVNRLVVWVLSNGGKVFHINFVKLLLVLGNYLTRFFFLISHGPIGVKAKSMAKLLMLNVGHNDVRQVISSSFAKCTADWPICYIRITDAAGEIHSKSLHPIENFDDQSAVTVDLLHESRQVVSMTLRIGP